MIYVAIDLETTGLNPDTCQVLEFGAVIALPGFAVEDLSTFRRVIKHGHIVGEPYALALNAAIIRESLEKDNNEVAPVHEIFTSFCAWLQAEGLSLPLTVAGKNFSGFDMRFLRRLDSRFEGIFRHRVLDVGSMAWDGVEDKAPSLQEAMQRAGITGTVAHTAVEDCLDVIRCIRYYKPASK